MNVSAFKVTLLYMSVHVNEFFYYLLFVRMYSKTPNFCSPGLPFMSEYSAV